MLQKFGQRKLILVLTVLFLLNLALFSLPDVPGSTFNITAAAPDLQIPDTLGIYSPEKVHAFLQAIGPEGRAAYQWMHFTTDLAFPLVYGWLLFAILCRCVLNTSSKFQRLPFLGWLIAAVDLAENFTLVAITDRYPTFSPALTRLAQVFTIAKFAGIALSLAAIIFLWVKKFRHSPNETRPQEKENKLI